MHPFLLLHNNLKSVQKIEKNFRKIYTTGILQLTAVKIAWNIKGVTGQ